MGRAQQTRFLVHVADWTEISTDDLKVCVLSNVVARHFEHSEMEIGNWRERPAGDEDDRLLGCILENSLQALAREAIVVWRAVRAHRGRGGGRWGTGEYVGMSW